MKMKRFLVGTFLGLFAFAGLSVLPNQVSAEGEDGSSSSTTTSERANPTANQNMISGKQLQGSYLLTAIKKTINWVLGILATISVCICLYAGFMMVTSAGDEKKYQKGFTILKYAAVGLVVIGLSWLIVSVIYWFINLQGGTDGSTLSGAQGTNN